MFMPLLLIHREGSVCERDPNGREMFDKKRVCERDEILYSMVLLLLFGGVWTVHVDEFLETCWAPRLMSVFNLFICTVARSNALPFY